MIYRKTEHLISALLNSYSQVFFSENKILGSILLLVTFFDYPVGFCGIIAVGVGLALAYFLNLDKSVLSKGLYSFNNLLVGLGIALPFQFSIELIVIVILSSVLTTLFTFFFAGVLQKYYLPFLSLPFLFGIWLGLKATDTLTALGLSVRGVFTQNEIYALGGRGMLNLYNAIENIIPSAISVYFKSLGAIFFQGNILAGILISLGLLLYSRIVFTLSILGYSLAFFFYNIFGADAVQLEYGYIGFNYILAAIAIGGYFYVPSSRTYLTIIFLLPLVVLLSLGLEGIFKVFHLPIYSLPFNMLVLMFLYMMQSKKIPFTFLLKVIVQQKTPERNLYLQNNRLNKLKNQGMFTISLPIVGEWYVSQGYSGKYTHKGEWKHGIDFILLDENGLQYQNQGEFVEDYFCYGKNVQAPADGYVVNINDGIEDNVVGKTNLIQNWGNTVVIQHTLGVYSQLSHLKKGTINLNIGDFVRKGTIVGKVGNSGRSPYPHLHFQIQGTPYIGSKTLNYPLSHFISNNSRYHSWSVPLEGEYVQNTEPTTLLKDIFSFSPGQELRFQIACENLKGNKKLLLPETEYIFVVHSDSLNYTYFECEKTGAKAWFVYDGNIFYFSNYEGTKDTFLYYFMLSFFKVETNFSKNITITEAVPIHFTHVKRNIFLQDFVAPFFQYKNSYYSLRYFNIDDEFVPQEIELQSVITNKLFSKTTGQITSQMKLGVKGIQEIQISINKKIKINAYV